MCRAARHASQFILQNNVRRRAAGGPAHFARGFRFWRAFHWRKSSRLLWLLDARSSPSLDFAARFHEIVPSVARRRRRSTPQRCWWWGEENGGGKSERTRGGLTADERAGERRSGPRRQVRSAGVFWLLLIVSECEMYELIPVCVSRSQLSVRIPAASWRWRQHEGPARKGNVKDARLNQRLNDSEGQGFGSNASLYSPQSCADERCANLTRSIWRGA